MEQGQNWSHLLFGEDILKLLRVGKADTGQETYEQEVKGQEWDCPKMYSERRAWETMPYKDNE